MKYRLSLGIAAILQSAAGHALTLGPVQVDSYINEPLKAHIDVEGVKPLDLKYLEATMASKLAFDAAGVDWNATVGQVRVRLDKKSSPPRLNLTTTGPVTDPFVSFVIETAWPTGKVVQDYTLLLDPPIYSFTPTAPVQVVELDTIEAREATAEEIEELLALKPEPAPAAEVPAPAATAQPAQVPTPAPQALETVTTRNGDSLWRVAQRVKPDSVSIHQAMVSLHEANPAAFNQGNMNALKRGQVMEIPPAEVMEGISEAAAIQRFSLHEQAWKAGTAVAASQERLSPELPAQQAEQDAAQAAEDALVAEQIRELEALEASGRLQLASAGETATDALATTGGAGGEATGDAAVLKEELVSSQQEAADLRLRLEQVEEQLSDTQALIELKDDQLAQLQEYYRRLNEQQAAAEEAAMPSEEAMAAVEEAADEGADAEQEEAGEAEQADTASAVPDSVATPQAVAETETTGEQQATAEQKETATASAQSGEASQESAQANTAPDAASETTAAADDPASDKKTGTDPMLYAYAGIGGAILLGLIAWLRRRKPEEEAGIPEEQPVPVSEMAESEAETAEDVPEQEAPQSSADAIAAMVAAEAVSQIKGETSSEEDAQVTPEEETEAPAEVVESEEIAAVEPESETLETALDDFESRFNAESPEVVSEAEETLKDTAAILDIDDAASQAAADEVAQDIDEALEFDLGDPADDAAMESALELSVEEPIVESVEETAATDDLGIDFKPSDPVDYQESVAAAKEVEERESGKEEDLLEFDLGLDEEQTSDEMLAELEESAEGPSEDDINTMVDLAKAFADMGDIDGAREMLQEAHEKGSDSQKAKISELLDNLG